jgi:hypothetical protein
MACVIEEDEEDGHHRRHRFLDPAQVEQDEEQEWPLISTRSFQWCQPMGSMLKTASAPEAMDTEMVST